MIVVSKLAILAVTASLLSGGALVALTRGTGISGGSDYGLDTDGDGLYDWLVVTMDVKVDTANYYNIWATLGTPTPFGHGCFNAMPPLPMGHGRPGDPLPTRPTGEPGMTYPISWATVRTFLEPGDHSVSIAFKGGDLGFAGVDGPYVVQAQLSADGQWGGDVRMLPPGPPTPGLPGPMPAPSGSSWTYTTNAYDARAFEQPRFAIRFTGTTSDAGMDTNGNGRYDELVVRADAQVNLAGPYSVGGSLMAMFNDTIDLGFFVTSAYGMANLTEGAQSIEVRFNGGEIGASGHEGAFTFALTAYYGGGYVDGGLPIREGEPYPPGPVGDVDVYGDTVCGRTAEYRHGEWEERPEPAVFTGAFADRGEDYDADGRYDVLAVSAEVNVTEANDFAFSGQLRSGDGATWIAADDQRLHLGVGLQTLTLRFSGPAIAAGGIDGPYRIDLSLVVAMRDPEATYTTAAYAHTDFDVQENRTSARTHLIGGFSGDRTSLYVRVMRLNDLLTYVIEDTILLQAYDARGAMVFEGSGKVYLPSGGDVQDFTFAWSPGPGTYTVRVTLGDPAFPMDRGEFGVLV